MTIGKAGSMLSPATHDSDVLQDEHQSNLFIHTRKKKYRGFAEDFISPNAWKSSERAHN